MVASLEVTYLFGVSQVSIHVSRGRFLSSPGGCRSIFLPKWHPDHGRSWCFMVAPGAGAPVLPLSCGSLPGSVQGHPSVPSLELSTCIWSHLTAWESPMICAVRVWGPGSTSCWQLSRSLKSHEDPQPLGCCPHALNSLCPA